VGYIAYQYILRKKKICSVYLTHKAQIQEWEEDAKLFKRVSWVEVNM